MTKIVIKNWDELEDREPSYAVVADVDLVVVRFDDAVSVLYGRCAHRGALMSDGTVDGKNLICGVHGWDYRLDSGISEYNNNETLPKFNAWVEDGKVFVDEDEIAAWAKQHPQPYQRDTYQGIYRDPTGTADEPHVKLIRKLANEGLSKVGITDRPPPWVCQETVCQSGMISNSSWANYTNYHCSITSQSVLTL